MRALLLLAGIMLALAPAEAWAQKEKPKQKKKAKLPPKNIAGAMLANAQYNFSASGLKGVMLTNPTSLQFGPDGRLYVSQQNGNIKVFTIVRQGPGDYTVTATETIDLVNKIANRNDDGTPNPNVKTRQVTGILVTGTVAQPVIYVGSSDSRIGGGSSAGDKNLDTNSGVISRLTKTSVGWEKVDLVRGLPRSEENHSINGIQLDEQTNRLYVAIGGFTNAGAPSNNFTFICEYALSAAILSVDLDAIDALPTQGSGTSAYKYDLPTLDDPTRPNNPDGTDVNDPFGGNDGLNQARIVPGGPVQISSPGYRNAYDLTITKTPGKARRLYTVDNGANGSWGGYPENEGGGNATNNYVAGEPGSTGPGVSDPKVNNLDNLHYVGDLATYAPGSHYGGHPTPTRANPAGAGLYTHNGTAGVWRNGTTGANPLPADWPPLPLSGANPVEGDYQQPGVTDRALITFSVSTNGLAEYTASNFNGVLKGTLLAAGYNGNIFKISLTEDGSNVTNPLGSSKLNGDLPFASGFGSQPLDVTTQGDNDIFPGTVWAATYGSDAITVFEPADFLVCSGEYTAALDDDKDGYSNADEIDNATNPCSSASRPDDSDGDLVSDLNDNDDDNDNLGDNVDYFALDASNGTNTVLPVQYPLFNNDPGTGLFGLGFTGLMSNKKPDNDWYNNFDEENLIAGGAVGAFSVVNVGAGDALGVANNQENAFQFGVNHGVDPFTVHGSMFGPFFNGQAPQPGYAQGLFVGTGDQDNYIRIVLNGHNGQGGVQVVYENNGQPVVAQYPLAGGMPGSTIDFYLSVDPATGLVQPRYAQDGGAPVPLGAPIQTSGALLDALQGTPALAVGIISTTGGGTPFTATWDFINVTLDELTDTGAWLSVVPTSGQPTARHENAYVQAGDKFFLMGGRDNKVVQVYDPVGKIWANKASAPVELHHFQAVTLNGLVYVAGAFGGNYPRETPVPQLYVYNPLTDKWITGATIPEGRRRGSAGAVAYNNKLYLVGGITDGHWTGHVTWFDEFDPATNTWKTLPNAPRARDHFHAAVVGSKLYLAGGRRTSASTNQTFSLTVPEVDVFDFVTGQWGTLPSGSNLPTGRAGAAAAVLGSELILIGGESTQALAHNQAEALNTKTGNWRPLANLLQGRHGTQAIVSNNGIYLAAGSAEQGSNPELGTQEAFYMATPTVPTGTALTQSPLTAPADVTFGSVQVGATETKTVTLGNAGENQDLVVTALSAGTGFAYDSPYALPFVIPVGKSVSLAVRFSPTSGGAKTASLIVTHSGLNGSSAIALSGQGTAVGITPSPAELHFFSQQAGTTSAAQAVTLTNHEATALQVSSVTLAGANGGEFAHSFTAPITLNAGATAVLNVTFSPASPGSKVAQLSIGHAGVNSPITVSLTGEGIDNPNSPPIVALPIPDQGANEGSPFGYAFPAGTFTDPDNDALTYLASLSSNAALPAWLLFNAATRTFSGTPPAGSAGSLTVRVTASDGEGGSVADEFGLGIAPPTGDVVVHRLNAGGPQVITSTGTFAAEAFFSTSSKYAATAAIAGTDDDALYQTHRASSSGNGSFSFNLPVSGAGQYKVILHFAELFRTAAGQRLFDVSLEGTKVLDNYDVFAEVGQFVATRKTFTVTVADGTLNLFFTAALAEGGVNRPFVSAIEVFRTPAQLPANQAPTVAVPIPNQEASIGTDFGYTFPAGTFTDPDNDALTYSANLSSNAALPAWLSFNAATRTFSGMPPAGSPASLTIKVTASDGKGGIASDEFGLGIGEPSGDIIVHRLNAGGPQVSTSTGTFAAEAFFSTSSKYAATAAIAGTDDDVLYQTHRASSSGNGSFSFNLPVSGAGQYKVILHFAELFRTAAGQRLFDVSLEGTKVLDNYDVFAEVGQFVATRKTFTVTVADGTLNLFFTAALAEGGVNRPFVSAIEVIKVAESGAARAGTVNDLPEGPSASIYPNPFAHTFRVGISGKGQEKLPLKVYDAYGRQVLQLAEVRPGQPVTLGKEFAPGVYILNLGEGSRSRRYKLVKTQ